MLKNKSLEKKIALRIARKKCMVVLRKDFEDLSGYDQVGRALRQLVAKGTLIKMGYGLYAKTKISPLTGQPIPQASLPRLAAEALKRLAIETAPSTLERAYQAGTSTQVPTGRLIAVKGRIRRKMGYDGAYVHFEHTS